MSVLARAAGVTACSSGGDTSPAPCADATANGVAAICEKGKTTAAALRFAEAID